jgi:predicted enzyme related to lactoylglutathione lyase
LQNPPIFIELPATDLKASQTFLTGLFGWDFTPFGPTYASTMEGNLDIGLQADPTEATKAPLPVIEVLDLEATLDAVTRAGARIVKPIFSFPGGRRFQFLDPAGNELAAMQRDPADPTFA